MQSTRRYRAVFAVALLVSALPFVAGAAANLTAGGDGPATTTAEPRQNVTVVTTNPPADSESALVAYAPNGSVLYYNSTYKYWDVDPVPGTQATVEYLAENDHEQCGALRCGSDRIERANLTTGEVELVHSFPSPGGTRGNGWHDFDRIDEHRLLVADIYGDRVFVFDTERDLITWQYEFGFDFRRSEGGVYPGDWTHLNDVEYLGNGTVMANPRNFDQVVFLDMESGLQSNRTLGSHDDYSTLYEPHNPDYIPRERGGPAVLVADSENNRVVEYQRTDGNWTRTWTWADRRLQWPRDADRLPNGNTLVTDSNGNRVVEVAPNGSVVWSVELNTPYEAERFETGDESTGGHSARALGLDSRGKTTTANASEDSGGGFARPLVAAVQTLLPSIVVNGLLWALPPWVGVEHVLSLAATAGVASVWLAAEFRWSRYRLRWPLTRE